MHQLKATSIYLSAWPSVQGRAPSSFTAHEFDGSRVQTPGVDTVNQAVHPSGVGKFVAINMQWVTAVEDGEGNCVGLYDGWRADYASGWRKLPHVGFLQFARASLKLAIVKLRRLISTHLYLYTC
jgi:hypothetical protein